MPSDSTWSQGGSGVREAARAGGLAERGEVEKVSPSCRAANAVRRMSETMPADPNRPSDLAIAPPEENRGDAHA